MYSKIFEQMASQADQEKAQQMAAYLKNQFFFFGLSRPVRNQLQKDFLQEAKGRKLLDWGFIDECWERPQRECQYLAMDYLIALQRELTEHDLKKVEKLIVAKSWWDTVDILASNLVGALAQKYPHLVTDSILPWAVDENIWLQRTAILFQLKYKGKTDSAVLAEIIGQTKDTNEFFLNKAIGWALREFSKTDPLWVGDFLNNTQLSKLSRREAGKYITGRPE